MASSLGQASLVLQRLAPLPSADATILCSGFVVGRDPTCDIQTHSSSTSRRHAALTYSGHLWRCEDLDSRNGTFVNGQRIRNAPVGPGDVIRCGGWVAVILRRSTEAWGLRFSELATGLYGGATLQLALGPLRSVATSALPVILEGETGTGKECVARAVHEWSGRTGPYLALNCAAIPEALVEAELFGHERGAFTGATQARQGHLRAARGGTLLLDEICDLSLAVQSKLLRVLDQQEVTPLGASSSVPIDVRIIAAAQRPLAPLVEAGRFREDLLARLGMIAQLPPLRSRIEDIPFLFELFARQAFERLPELDGRLVEALLLNPFPRNVRQLRQTVKEIALLHRNAPRLGPSALPAAARPSGFGSDPPPAPGTEPPPPAPPAAPDWPRLCKALEACGGNVRRAASLVGISRYQAYRLLRAHPEFDVDSCRRRSNLTPP